MTSQAVVIDPARRERIRRTRRKVVTVLIVIICSVSSFGAAALATGIFGQPTDYIQMSWVISGAFGGIGVAVLLIWRHRWPHGVTIIAAVSAIFLPMDPLAALIAFSILVSLRRGTLVWWCGALTYAATVATLWRDALAGNDSVLNITLDPKATEHTQAAPFWLVLVVATVLFGISLGIGLWRRTLGELQVVRYETVVLRENEERHLTEAERQHERDALAREVHDTLASRLSLVSLHSGALEVAATETDPAMVEAARVVRDAAHQSLDDLRQLIGTLRGPTAGATPPPVRTPSLADIPALVDEARAAGNTINANVFLYEAAHFPPELGLTAYRLVQECLTNARKHAPGATITLDLRGGAGSGLTLKVVNAVPPTMTAHAGIPGSGVGMRGMQERVKALGGRLAAWLDPVQGFVVDAWLPWPAPSGPTMTP